MAPLCVVTPGNSQNPGTPTPRPWSLKLLALALFSEMNDWPLLSAHSGNHHSSCGARPPPPNLSPECASGSRHP